MNSIYVQGFSTSMPHDIQEQMIRTLPGLENCTILKYAYAIEYDAIDPLQMKPNMESKIVENLFTAGQVNGTSGYEEAAGQGLMAGANASLKVDGKEPLVLRRDEAYIGVMLDDLCTKGTKEPYRLLTSRAEYRLLLRHDNAEERLIETGRRIGLVTDEHYARYVEFIGKLKAEKDKLANKTYSLDDEKLYPYLQSLGYDTKEHVGVNGIELLKRPGITTKELAECFDEEVDDEIANKCDIDIKYEGYIAKARREADKLASMEEEKLGLDFNYDEVDNLSLEGRQKLKEYQPMTIGQASRISGVNPADIAVLAIAIKQGKGRKK